MAESIRVLHVDDEPDFTALTAEFLQQESDRLEVVTATSGADGLDRLADGDIDCLVSDYQMPDMDGLEFLDAVRQTHPELPFILFTGQGSERVASEALSAGATEYLRKDAGTEQYELLANRIENAVESRRAQERVAELERIRRTLADINQALVRASSREEVEAEVCDIIGRLDTVRLVVFSAVDPETKRVEPRTWSGGETGYLDAVEITVEPSDGEPTPHERAFAEREVAASRDIQTDPAFEPWREAIAETDLHALAVMPLAYEDDMHGLLGIYSGRPQPIDHDARALLKELGDDVGIALSAIERRRELRASEARYRTLTEAVSDAIVTIDDTSTITYVNPATIELFGYDREELMGAPLTALMPERLRESHREGIGRYLRTGNRTLDWTGIELPGRRADGSEVPLSISFGEFEHDGSQFFTGVIRDVTDRTERQAALRRRNEDLDEFVGLVAHDLRSPLQVAMGRLELAAEECDSEHLEAIGDTLDRMERLIEDLLRLARQGQDIDEVDPVAFDAIVDEARGAVDDATVVVDGPLETIVGHRDRVRLLVENLFRNAVEHGGPGVTIRVTMLDGGFAVEDDGPGIAAADREDVFEPGFSTKADGTGFGLNIVRKVVDAHGWEIAITEGTDGGARFEITGVDRPVE